MIHWTHFGGSATTLNGVPGTTRISEDGKNAQRCRTMLLARFTQIDTCPLRVRELNEVTSVFIAKTQNP
jgi:hypothetical protein